MALGKKKEYEEAEVYVAFYRYGPNKWDPNKQESQLKVVESLDQVEDRDAGDWVKYGPKMDVSKGDKILMQYEDTGKGLKMHSYKVVGKGAPSSSGGGKSSGGGTSFDPKGPAWGNSLTAAVALVPQLIASGILADPAKSKKGDSFEVYMSYIKLTRRALYADHNPPSDEEVEGKEEHSTPDEMPE